MNYLLAFLLFAFSVPALAQETIVRAEKAIEAKDYATALQLLNAHVEKNPKDFRALFDIAYAYTLMGERQKAVDAYRRVLEVNPKLTQAKMNLGILLLEDKRASEAATHFQAVVAERPKDARAHLLLADSLQQAGDATRAVEAYNQVLALQPDSYDATLGLTRIAIVSKDYSSAEKHLTRLAELAPRDIPVQIERARLYEVTGRTEDAERLYRDLVAKTTPDAQQAAVRRSLGGLLLARKQFGEAAGEFEAAARMTPAQSDAWNLARAYAGAKRHAEAAPLLRRVVNAEPRNFDARLLLGNTLLALRDFPAAQRELETAIALRPEFPDAYVDLANLLYLQQNYPATLAVLDRVARLAQPAGQTAPVPSPWLFFLRAISLDKLDQVEPALDSYERFLAVAGGKFPDQEFQARQRSKVLNLRLEKSGKRRRR